jgi:predicted Zn-dependent peptidase
MYERALLAKYIIECNPDKTQAELEAVVDALHTHIDVMREERVRRAAQYDLAA